MTVIELVTDIDAPVPLVFDLARDLDLHARSMAHTGERAIAGRTSGLVEEGDTVTWRARHLGRYRRDLLAVRNAALKAEAERRARAA